MEKLKVKVFDDSFTADQKEFCALDNDDEKVCAYKRMVITKDKLYIEMGRDNSPKLVITVPYPFSPGVYEAEITEEEDVVRIRLIKTVQDTQNNCDAYAMHVVRATPIGDCVISYNIICPCYSQRECKAFAIVLVPPGTEYLITAAPDGFKTLYQVRPDGSLDPLGGGYALNHPDEW